MPGSCGREEEKYGEVLAELQEEGIRYLPTVWSCWGRPDTHSVEVVRVLAAAAARRRGLGDPAPLARRTHAVIGTQIWRRAACMVHACLGRTPAEDVDELMPLGPVDEVDTDEEQPSGPGGATAAGAGDGSSSALPGLLPREDAAVPAAAPVAAAAVAAGASAAQDQEIS